MQQWVDELREFLYREKRLATEGNSSRPRSTAQEMSERSAAGEEPDQTAC